VISWQMDSGGWAKDNAQLYKRMWNGKESKAGGAGLEVATIDNDATVPELRFLIREYNRTQETFILESIYKGIDFLIEMQYTSGAYPQHYPLIKNSSVPYYDYATFNDNATVMVLGFFRDIKYNKQRYGFLDEAYHKKIDNALNKGIEFILKSQIEANGVLTAWCAQHDPFTYEPKPGRSYELVSISGLESVGITDFLISLKSNDPRIVKSIQSAKQWFKEVAVYDMAFYMNGKDGKYFIPTKNQIIWYRFYEIGTNKGFFANRDGSKVYDIMEVKAERRHNYLWAGSWAKHLLE
jgi:PelA/Pel-15E family pectate lyase